MFFFISIVIAFVIYGLKINLFSSKEVLKTFLEKFGIWAPIILIAIQAIQVVFPVLPGGIGLLGGVIIFGPVVGFIYNYIGICIGSFVAFCLSKKYGLPLINLLFSSKLKNRYVKWIENEKFNKYFTIAIFMPVAPDDFLCYLAGTTDMSFKRFITVILLGKPLAIAIYSFGLNIIFKEMLVLFMK
nr:VTT domain-containing protein [Tissierella sp.]